MGREPVDKHMDKNPSSITGSSTGSAEVQECIDHNLVAHDDVDGSESRTSSSDNKKNRNTLLSHICRTATSVRSDKPKITVGVSPTFERKSRLERHKEFYKKLEEKQKALEEEKRENKKRLKEEQEVVAKQLRNNMVYKANLVPNFYYEAPPLKLQLKKFPLTRPKSPNLNRRNSCSNTVNSSHQEVKGNHCARYRHSVGGCKEKSIASNIPRTPNVNKFTKGTQPKSREFCGRNKSGHERVVGEKFIDVVSEA
ncbi:unnamed protein product [Eruca vesicaria subsp. sativa]|uniref:TPX2 C-terminal domain-containing protein n=1 Tax=Eruca vesicaria subsp. sativa TaxID=29727 RepID=A0ABC8JXE5_ERUVS|nr:unnamed protein product [Eruca vesicaria subsp. sativa]